MLKLPEHSVPNLQGELLNQELILNWRKNFSYLQELWNISIDVYIIQVQVGISNIDYFFLVAAFKLRLSF